MCTTQPRDVEVIQVVQNVCPKLLKWNASPEMWTISFYGGRIWFCRKCWTSLWPLGLLKFHLPTYSFDVYPFLCEIDYIELPTQVLRIKFGLFAYRTHNKCTVEVICLFPSCTLHKCTIDLRNLAYCSLHSECVLLVCAINLIWFIYGIAVCLRRNWL